MNAFKTMKKILLFFAVLFSAFSATGQLTYQHYPQPYLTFSGPQSTYGGINASTTWHGRVHTWVGANGNDRLFLNLYGSQTRLEFNGPQLFLNNGDYVTTTWHGKIHAWVHALAPYNTQYLYFRFPSWNQNHLEIVSSEGGLQFRHKPLGSASSTFSTLYALGYFVQSDIDAKTNIVPVNGALSTVLALQPVTYQWRDQATNNSVPRATPNPKEIGFIAQDLESVIPDIVAISDDNTRLVNYQAIIPILTAAIQELTARIEVLENQLKAK